LSPQSSGIDWPLVRWCFSAAELGPYIVAQVAGGLAGAAILYVITSGQAGFDASASFASNGYGEHSPGGYSMTAALVTEIVMTFMFLTIILGTTVIQSEFYFSLNAINPTTKRSLDWQNEKLISLTKHCI
jgi:glycerol uptake facilitator-like aquaporin